jgi:hypothetical protein
MYSPRWLFLIPGVLLVLLGLIGYGLAMPGFMVMGVAFDAHTLLFASLAILCGYQSILCVTAGIGRCRPSTGDAVRPARHRHAN